MSRVMDQVDQHKGILGERAFWWLIALVTLMRLGFALWLPVKNDEAYYILWGQHLAAGYFDHPPLIGWLLHLMSYLSGSIAWFRMFAIGAGLFATWVVYVIARDMAGVAQARFAALLFALSPANVLLFIISNDAPLLVLCLMAVLAYRAAINREDGRFALLAGLLLGAAFLAKYLAVLIGLGLFVHALMGDRRRRLVYVGLVLAGAAPFVLQHLWFNYHHEWITLRFHLYLRGGGRALDWTAPVSLIAGAAIVFTPWLVWALMRRGAQLRGAQTGLVLAILVTGMGLLTLAAMKTVIGLHFFLLFAPYAFVLAALIHNLSSQRRMLIANLVYSVFLGAVIAGIMLYPLKRLEGARNHADAVFGLHPAAVCQALTPYNKYPLFADFYTPAAILDYSCGRRVGVLFGFSAMGREFDRYTDIRALDGKTLVIFNIGKVSRAQYKDYFVRHRIETIQVMGAPFTLFIGEGFRAEKYEREIVSKIRDYFYSVPPWLPQPVAADQDSVRKVR